MTKIAYNACYGGFYLSSEAIELGKELSGDKNWGSDKYWPDAFRQDPILIRVIEILGKKANTGISDLAIEEIPSGSFYRIRDRDGKEFVEQKDSVGWVLAV